MPRHRYKKVFISSPSLHSPMVELCRVGDAVAVVDALGRGSVTLKTEDLAATIPIEHLRGKNDEAIWRLFDGEIDVETAKLEPSPPNSRRIDPEACGRWPGCPADIMNVLNGYRPDAIYRLRHFAAISIAKIRVIQHHFSMSEFDRACIDAGLTETERIIARRADNECALRDLLWLR